MNRGPINTFLFVRDLINANFTDVVSPNADTLYGPAYLDLKNGPLVLKVPAISDRYYTIQFLDAYDNNFNYIGTRTNATSGGTYLITGPNWNDTVPNDRIQVKSPTNKVWMLNRILVTAPDDVTAVRALQDKFSLSPLSKSSTPPSNATTVGAPIPPQPEFIPTTGIKIYDEISLDMVDNPPYIYDADVIAKFKSIGIGPNLIPSETSNQTVLEALEQGIVNGEKLIDEKLRNLGTVINGWQLTLGTGDYGTDYLLRAAIAKDLLGANSEEEAVYPYTYVDAEGKNLTGTNNYVIHFDKVNLPPVDGFWSISMYNSKKLFVDNPINRYSIGDQTQGLNYNSDGSLDIYIQNESPGKDKESNWLPSPIDVFGLTLRMYIPHEIVLNGEYQISPVQVVN